jgi:hypothetical protein
MTIKERISLIKAIVRPVITILMVLGWITFIGAEIDVPLAYESITITIVTEYVIERGYKRVKEIKNGKKVQGE